MLKATTFQLRVNRLCIAERDACYDVLQRSTISIITAHCRDSTTPSSGGESGLSMSRDIGLAVLGLLLPVHGLRPSHCS